MYDLPVEYRHEKGIGEEVQFDHKECGDTRSRFYVKRIAAGYLYHCHNCFDPGNPETHGFFRTRETPPPSQTLKQYKSLKEGEIFHEEEINLPYDFTTRIPAVALRWLYHYGITDDEILEFGFGYSPGLERLILPVWTPEGELIYWQGRTFGEVTKENPKYINVSSRGRDVFFENAPREYDTLVMVEDILSAIKVGRHMDCVALLGSYIPDSIFKLTRVYTRIMIWLDPDKSTQAYKYARRAAVMTGKQTKPILGHKDPKEYSDKEIELKCSWL